MTANGQSNAANTYYPTGSVVSLAASPASGWSFVRWQGTASSTANPFNISMNQTQNVQAIFGTVVSSNIAGSGSIVMSATNPVPYGTDLTLTAVPAPGYRFVTWSGAVSETNNPKVFTVTNATPMVGALFAPTPCTPWPAGLVSWWRGEDNVNNTANTNAGFLVGGATFAAGKVGRAFSLNGTTAYVEVPDAPNLRFTNALTLESWIYTRAVGGHHREILSKWGGGGYPQSYTLSIQPSGLLGCGISGDGSPGNLATVLTDVTVPTNEWLHTAMVYDGSALILYINGVPHGSSLWTNGIFPGNSPLIIGYALATGSYFDGLIDEPSVYSRALSSSEIQAIYNAGSYGKCVPPPPVITSQPTNQTVASGSITSFAVTAAGTEPLSYQWRRNGTNITGATNALFTLDAALTNNAGDYRVVVSNPYGQETSTVATLTVFIPASLSSGPVSQLVAAHDTATFSVAAFGYPALNYQWRFDGADLPGATSSSLVITNVGTNHLGYYWVEARNAYSAVTSPPAALLMSPSLRTPYTGLTAIWGKEATLAVSAWGSGNLSYQWFKDGQAVLGATNATIVYPTVQVSDGGLYSVVISSPYGSVTNTPAQLVVNPANITLELYAGIVIEGVPGYTYGIEYTTDLTDTHSWQSITNVTLTQPVEKWADTSVNVLSSPKRFYRVTNQ